MSKLVTDSKMKFRDRLSAMLYVSMVAVSIAICLLTTIANPTTFANAFTDEAVVQALEKDVKQYASDICQKNNIPNSFVDEAIKYDSLFELEKAYIYGNLGGSDSYNEKAFEGLIESLTDTIAQKLDNMLKGQGITVAAGVTDAQKTYAKDISSYVSSRIQFDYINNVKSGISTLKMISYAMLVIFGIAGAIELVLLFTKGGKNYRIIRNVAYSVLGASIMNLLFVIIISLVKATKDLIIYPLYIADAFMNYVNISMVTLASASGALFVVFLLLAVVSWRMKRSEKD